MEGGRLGCGARGGLNKGKEREAGKEGGQQVCAPNNPYIPIATKDVTNTSTHLH
jgi:hypothetical protein